MATAELAERARTLESSFTGRIAPVRVTAAYQLALMAVAAAMLILPLIYLGMIAAVAWLLWLHAVHDASVFEGHGSIKGKLLLYVLPLAVGGAILLFMVKPLFARRRRQAERCSLDPAEEPVLFAFVVRLCATVGAPVPSRIDVDTQVNASASFRRGLLSVFGNDLVLTLGLPLIAGMSSRQVAGILAHEFGHFAQGAGMRFTLIIRTVSAWFARVVYERDEWDERLLALGKDDGWMYVMVGIARLCIWITRRILWLLMVIGQAMSCFMARQMEFDADRYEARVAGSDAYAGSAARLRLLGYASRGAFSDLGAAWQEGRLSDDLPALVAANIAQLPEDLPARIAKAMKEERTGLFDTHPCDRERIASAAREATAGVFTLDQPATTLFADFPAVARRATIAYYREELGARFDPAALVPTAAIASQGEGMVEGGKAAARFFQGVFGALAPLPAVQADAELASGDPDTDRESLAAARAAMLELAPAARAAYRAVDTADDRQLDALRARHLALAKVPFRAERFSLPKASAEAATRALAESAEERLRSQPQLDAFLAAAWRRQLLALRLAAGASLQERLGAALEPPERLRLLIAALATLTGASRQLEAMRNEFVALSALTGSLERQGDNQTLIGEIRGKMASVQRRLVELKTGLGSALYPFDHAKGEIAIAEWAFPGLPPSDDLGALMAAAHGMLDRLYGLRGRIAGRLAVIAELVESAHGLEPLSEPPPGSPPAAASAGA